MLPVRYPVLGLLPLFIAMTPAAQAEQADRASARGHEKELSEILVTADPLQRAAHDPVQPTEVIAGADLEDQRSTTIGESVARQTGVQSSYFGPGVGRPIIRGLDGARIQVLANGASGLDASAVSVDHATTVDPFLADQIEILKGPSTLFFGSGAIGGVVNVVDGRIPEQAEPGLRGRAELAGDSVANTRSGMARLDAGSERASLHVDVFERNSDDFDAPAGEISNSALHSRGGALGGSLFGARGFAGAAVSRFESRYGIPAGDDEGAEAVRIDMRQTRADTKAALDNPIPGIERALIKFSQNDYRHVELEGDEVGTRFDLDSHETRLEFTHAALGAWRGAFGAQFGARDLLAIGEEAFIPPTETSDWGVFAIERFSSGPFDLELGLRHDQQEVAAGALGDVRHHAQSASLSAAWRLGERWSLAAGFDHAERSPVAEELYADGPHIATAGFERGDPALDIETARQAELGLHYDGDGLHFKLSLYRNRFHDFIYLEETGTFEDELPLRQWSQADARFRGAEFELKSVLGDFSAGRFELRLFGDTVRGTLASGENLPRMAPQRLGADLNWDLSGWRARIGAVHYAEQDRVAAFESTTTGYTLIHAHVSYAFNVGGSEWEWFADGSNLGDRRAHVHTSFLKDVAPLPGRNLRTGLRLYF
jgi:iron complex outermembrane recepter protein